MRCRYFCPDVIALITPAAEGGFQPDDFLLGWGILALFWTWVPLSSGLSLGLFQQLWAGAAAGAAQTCVRTRGAKCAGTWWAALTAQRASPDCMCLCGLLLELSRHKQNLGSDNVRFASLSVLSCVTCFPSTGGNLKNLPCIFVSRALVDLWDPTQLGGGLLKHFIFPGLGVVIFKCICKFSGRLAL